MLPETRRTDASWSVRLGLCPAERKTPEAIAAAVAEAAADGPALDRAVGANRRGWAFVERTGLFEIVERLGIAADCIEDNEWRGTEIVWICPDFALGVLDLSGRTDADLEALARSALRCEQRRRQPVQGASTRQECNPPPRAALRAWIDSLVRQVARLGAASRRTEVFCAHALATAAEDPPDTDAALVRMEDIAGDMGIWEPPRYGPALARGLGLLDAEICHLNHSGMDEEVAGISLALAAAAMTAARPPAAPEADESEAMAGLIAAGLEVSAAALASGGARSGEVSAAHKPAFTVLAPPAVRLAARALAWRNHTAGMSEARELAIRMNAVVHGCIDAVDLATIRAGVVRFARASPHGEDVVREVLCDLVAPKSAEEIDALLQGGGVCGPDPRTAEIEAVLTAAFRAAHPAARFLITQGAWAETIAARLKAA